ncbi:hypothetical protein HK101_003379 [Irineochytrium annulatum]|nr:hypothetical protein HK101_003379 [Irineochytrium annulatum]
MTVSVDVSVAVRVVMAVMAVRLRIVVAMVTVTVRVMTVSVVVEAVVSRAPTASTGAVSRDDDPAAFAVVDDGGERDWRLREVTPEATSALLSLTSHAMSVACFAAAHIRAVASSAPRRAEVMEVLSKGMAFEATESVAVVMVDISGYSKMSAELGSVPLWQAVMGKIASELITRSVGAFLDRVIEVITAYGGDIVKFLGMDLIPLITLLWP